MNEQKWHSLPISDVITSVDGKEDGLSSKEALLRLKKFGKNELQQKKQVSNWLLFFRQMYNPLMAFLAVAVLLKLVMHQFTNALAIGFVMVFNSFLGFLQERKAEKSLQSIRKLTATPAKVFRDGSLQEIDAKNLVPGDLLFLESGARICADARLTESHALEIDESVLTGESSSVFKNATLTLPQSLSMFDQKNMVFSGSTVVRGRGKAIVIATGTSTQTASIAAIAEEAVPPITPLQERLAQFGKQLTIFIFISLLLITGVGYAQGTPLLDLVMTCVSLTVAAIPEGLPMAVTIVLSIGLLRMLEKKAVVRKLHSIETLGCTSVICTDKTGTLTKNQLALSEFFLEGKIKSVSSLTHTPSAMWAARIGHFCSETTLKENNEYVGDPIDAALMRFAKNSGFLEKSQWKQDLVLPFESERQMMVSAIQGEEGSFLLYKGAFESISPLCKWMWLNNEVVEYDDHLLRAAMEEMASRGLRVIALAYKESSSPSLTMVALAGLLDPPRDEVVAAISTCQKAHIRVIMATGDHKETACTIAKQVGIPATSALTGPEIDDMDDRTFSEALSTTSVFARVSPRHKLRIVQQLQHHNEIVAMTGDGVNDAPPLRQADIGIAMGSGTEVAKEASSVVILDDNFASIVEAVRQGRVIFKSLQQLAVYLLTTCTGSVLTIGASVFCSLPLPLLPLQLLWINLITDGTNTIPLSLEGEHGNVMFNPPRKKRSHFLSSHMFIRALLASCTMMIGTISIFYWSMRTCSLEHSRTMAFTALALFQMLNALNSRSVRRSLFFSFQNGLSRIPFLQNKWLLFTLFLCLVLQILAVEWIPLQKILETTALSIHEWALLGMVSLSVVVIVEIHKLTLRTCLQRAF